MPRTVHVSIQYLRGIAALMVVAHHARNPQPWLPNHALGQFNGFSHGVDIFFVISGFIMAVVGINEPPRLFALKRLIRVVPIYWAATLIAAVPVVLHQPVRDSLERLVLSLLFVPHHDAAGHLWPILIPGWTLNYEMLFYAVFCACLFTRRPLLICSLSIAAIVGGAAILSSEGSDGAILEAYRNPVMLEFVAGMLIGRHRRGLARMPWLSWAAPAGFAGVLFCSNWLGLLASSSVLVAGAVSLETQMPTWRPLLALGDASYFLYLSQHFVIVAVLGAFRRLGLHGPFMFPSLFACALLCAVAVGWAGHRLIERPLTRRLQSWALGAPGGVRKAPDEAPGQTVERRTSR